MKIGTRQNRPAWNNKKKVAEWLEIKCCFERNFQRPYCTRGLVDREREKDRVRDIEEEKEKEREPDRKRERERE